MSSLLASAFILARAPKSPPFRTCARTPLILLRAAALSAAVVPAGVTMMCWKTFAAPTS